MSNSPQSLDFSWPTQCGLSPELFLYQPWFSSWSSSSPKEYRLPAFPARQQYSHSASVGKRYSLPSFLLNDLQKSTALCQETNTTGSSSDWSQGGFFQSLPPTLYFVSSTNRRNVPTVTSVVPM